MTRKALRDLLKVAGENLAYHANPEKLREFLAALVLKRYQELGAQFQSDPGVRLEVAKVHRVIGGIGRITGQFDKARESYALSIDMLERLTAEHPSKPNYRRWLAEAYNDRGELYHMNGLSDLAVQDFKLAMEQARRLRSSATLNMYRRVRAKPLINLSEVLALQNRLDAALAPANEAVDLLNALTQDASRTAAENEAKKLAKNDDDVDTEDDTLIDDQWLLSMALTDRAAVSLEADNPDGAEADLKLAETVAEQILASEPDHTDAQFQLASICNRRGELLALNAPGLAEAEKQYGRAQLLLAELVRGRELIPHYREEMAVTLMGRANVRCSQGTEHLADAESDCNDAKRLLEKLIEEQKTKGVRVNPDYLSSLSRAYVTASRIELARGDRAKALDNLQKAATMMNQAIAIDVSRARDRAFLDQVKTKLEDARQKSQ